MKVVLCSPPSSRHLFRKGENLGIGYLGAVSTAAGLDCQVLDAEYRCWGVDKTVEVICSVRPRVVGLSISHEGQIGPATEVLGNVASALPGVIWIAGGHVATFSAEELLRRLRGLTCVVRGEADQVIVQLLRILGEGLPSHMALETVPGLVYRDEEQVIATAQAPIAHNLDALPFPLRGPDSTGRIPTHVAMLGSRGCFGRCSFCTVPSLIRRSTAPRWRLRSAANLVEEITLLVRRHHVTHVSFVDDSFVGRDSPSRSRAFEFARTIRDSGARIKFSIECRSDAVEHDIICELKLAGLARVFVGMESGSDEALRRFNKGITVEDNHRAIDLLQKLGVPAAYGFLMFDPDASCEDLLKNLEFLDRHGIATYKAICSQLTPYPGTRVWEDLRRDGRLVGDPLRPRYVFLRPEVEQYLASFRSLLRDFEETDVCFRKLEFELTHLPDGLRVESEREHRTLQRKYSSGLCHLARALLGMSSSAIGEAELHKLATQFRQEILRSLEVHRAGCDVARLRHLNAIPKQ